MDSFVRVDPERLLDFATAVYARVGMSEPDARLAADTLVQADLWGHQSHGVMRLSWYLAPSQGRRLRPGRRPELVVDAGAHCRDRRSGRHGPGAYRTRRAGGDDEGQGARHRRGGAAQLQPFRHRHVLHADGGARRLRGVPLDQREPGDGALGRAKEDGRHQSLVAGRRRPARHAPMVLDIANTGVARGKIYLARQKGLPIPEGWAIDPRAPRPPIRPRHRGHHPADGPAQGLRHRRDDGHAVGRADRQRVRHGRPRSLPDRAPQRRRAADDRARHRGLPAVGRVRRAHGADDRRAEVRAVGARASRRSSIRARLEARNDARNRAEGILLPQDTIVDLGKLANEWSLPLPFEGSATSHQGVPGH